MKIKVGVIFGGETVEHEVSIISAVQAMEHMNKDKYDIVPIYISKDRIWYTGKMLMDIDVYQDFKELKRYAKEVVLTKTKDGYVLQNTKGLFKRTVAEIDIAFPIVHGNNVEDGSLQGYLDSVGIPYVGSTILGSALGQDKIVLKQVLDSYKIPNPAYTWFFDFEYQQDSETIIKNIEKLKYPVIIKPARLGSSVGIKIAKDRNELIVAIEDAVKYDSKILVETVIKDLKEVNCAVVGNSEYQETSLIALMKTKNEFLTYEDKYIGSGKGGKKGGNLKSSSSMDNGDFRIPANLSEKLASEVTDLAKKTFRVLNLSGVARIDFLIDSKSKKVYINEPNTIPGSLSFYMFDKATKNYTKLLDELITLSIKDYKNSLKKVTTFDNNILSTYKSNGGLKGGKKM